MSRDSIRYKINQFFLSSFQVVYGFDEKSARQNIQRFRYNRLLYNISLSHDDYEDNDTTDATWQTDTDLFIQTCNIALGNLSHFVDPNSVFFMDMEIWRQLVFSQRIIDTKLRRNNNKLFAKCDEIYHVFTALKIAMYICSKSISSLGSELNTGGGGVFMHAGNTTIHEWMKFYNKRFHSPYSCTVTSDTDDDYPAVFPHYEKTNMVCKTFIELIKL